MNTPSPKTLIAIVSCSAVLTAAVVDLDRTAPGPLHTAHARIAELDGGNDCAQCHGGWTTSMTDACLDCHDAIDEHIETGRGLHGTLGSETAADCAACHSDHHGAGFASVNQVSFARAGVADVAEFDHGLVSFDMAGAHLELDCAECHEHSEAAILPEGAHRYLGLDQSCATCHDDVHEGALGDSCADCHTQVAFTDHVFTGHDRFLPLLGGHAGLDCRTCHEEGTAHSLEAQRGAARNRPVARDCRACHDQPHDRSFVHHAALSAGVRGPMALTGSAANRLCVDCHEHADESFADAGVDMTDRQHAASGFRLEVPHESVDCAGCHAPDLSFAERYPGRGPNECAACHEDPHGGQFAGAVYDAVADLAGGDVDDVGCLVCHTPTHFDPHTFGTEAHAQTALALEDAHAIDDCSACHALDEADVRLFRGIGHTCETCHTDAHGGFFDALLAGEGASADLAPPPESGDCARCHTPTAFADVPPETFDHGLWTGFELDGAHAAEECSSCHVRTDAADEHGRTFGRVDDIYGEVVGCVSCHDDVHEGRFDASEHLLEVDGRSDCARCHSTASFRDASDDFDHARWTGWPLDGAHAAADCTSCHAPLRRPDEHGRTWARANGTDCASCHEGPHGDQFGAQPGLKAKSCERCHESAESFGTLSFDHDIESRFPLDEAHAVVDCAGCHEPNEETGIVAYRPLSRDCVDCHGVHERALRRRGRR